MKCSLKTLLIENHKNDYGCLMALINSAKAKQLIDMSKKLIPDKNLYIDKNDSTYGRETEPHCTILFGFTSNLTEEQLKQIVKGIKPFNINASGISLFKGNGKKPYDVVKMDVNVNRELNIMRKRCELFPYHTDFPTFRPHITIAYVKPNSFNHVIENKNINFLVDNIKYSGIGTESKKIVINLNKSMNEFNMGDFIIDQGFLSSKTNKK